MSMVGVRCAAGLARPMALCEAAELAPARELRDIDPATCSMWPLCNPRATSGGYATPTLTLKLGGLGSGALKLGKRLTAKGKATPASLAGGKVTPIVQRNQGGAWRKVKNLTVTIGAKGTYGATDRPAQKGSYRIQGRDRARRPQRPPAERRERVVPEQRDPQVGASQPVSEI